jgi:hypothetical protein
VPADATRVSGKDFVIPVPPGFRPSPVTLGPDTIALMERQRPAGEGGFLATIVVSPVATDDADCATIASKTGRMAKLTIVGAPVVIPECQFEATDPQNPHRAARFILRRKGPSLWMITCNHDPADAAARAACQAVLDQWSWT